jgi:hypothetical protein
MESVLRVAALFEPVSPALVISAIKGCLRA